MDKEKQWREKRIGKITSSSLHLLNSKSGSWTQTNKSYLYSLQRERWLKQPRKNVVTQAMQIGIDNEKYAIEWLRHNCQEWEVQHCDVDFDEKVFIETDFGLGDSPDGYVRCSQDHAEDVLEIKCVVSESDLAWLFSNTVPYEKKKEAVLEQHKEQIIGHMLAHPTHYGVWLLKYDPQDDNDEWDLRSPLDESRGLLFYYSTFDFLKDKVKLGDRIQFAENYLNSGKDIDEINKYWDEYNKNKEQTKPKRTRRVPKIGD